MLSREEQILAKIIIQHQLVKENIVRQLVSFVEESRQQGNSISFAEILLRHNHISQDYLQKAFKMVQEQLPKTNEMNKPQQTEMHRFNMAELKHRFHEQMFGRYLLKEELGRGGMGIVFKANDTKLMRIVALKVLLKDNINEISARRFLKEAEATAKLKHPNIVDLYEINDHPTLYFTMEFIDGAPLSYLIAKGLKLKDTLTIIYKCANAIGFANKNNIVHRDIKPSNIMIGKDQNPKVMDFGLAKDLSNSDNLSLEGDLLGTPAYMSPEQANNGKVDARSDVYSLGATFYQALVGSPPFQSDNYLHVLKMIHSDEPIPPRNLNRAIPADVEAICLKCLEKKPNKRYPNALALAKDIENFLNNRAITAKSQSKVVKLYRFLSRHKVASGFIILTIIFISIFLASTWMQNSILHKANKQAEEARRIAEYERSKVMEAYKEIDKERKIANEQREEANKARKTAEESYQIAEGAIYKANILLAYELIKNYQFKRAQDILDSCLEKKRNWEWFFLQNLTDASSPIPKELDQVDGHISDIASFNNLIVLGNNKGSVLIYDTISKKIIQTLQTKASTTVFKLSFSKSGKYLACIVNKNTSPYIRKSYCFIWKTNDWSLVQTWHCSSPISTATSCIFTLDEKKIVISYYFKIKSSNPNDRHTDVPLPDQGNIIVWDIQTAQNILTIHHNTELGRSVYDVIIASDGNIISVGEKIGATDDELIRVQSVSF